MAFDLDDEELKATRRMNGSDKNVDGIEELIEELTKVRPHELSKDGLKLFEYINEIIDRNKELEEELKEDKELNKIIKNTKLDELFTRPRRNGKTIELAMRLREEILKLPECKLYGIKNCKNKVVLLTKEECIPVSLVEEKIEKLNRKEQELQNSISDEEREEYSDANISFELMDIEIKRSILEELLEKRK